MIEESPARRASALAVFRSGLAFAFATSLLAACASPTEAEHPDPRPLGADLAAYTAPQTSAAAPPPPAEEPRGTLDLPGALAAALLRNPGLAAFSWEVRSRQAIALQAGLLPNPELGIEVENFAGSGETSGFDAKRVDLPARPAHRDRGQALEAAQGRGPRRRRRGVEIRSRAPRRLPLGRASLLRRPRSPGAGGQPFDLSRNAELSTRCAGSGFGCGHYVVASHGRG